MFPSVLNMFSFEYGFLQRDALKFLVSALKRSQSGATKKHGTDWRKAVEDLVEKVFLSGMEKVEEVINKLGKGGRGPHLESNPFRHE